MDSFTANWKNKLISITFIKTERGNKMEEHYYRSTSLNIHTSNQKPHQTPTFKADFNTRCWPQTSAPNVSLAQRCPFSRRTLTSVKVTARLWANILTSSKVCVCITAVLWLEHTETAVIIPKSNLNLKPSGTPSWSLGVFCFLMFI